MGLDSIQFVSLCLLLGAFSPFIFKVYIVMCEFDPVIMMLAGYFAHSLMQLLHSVNGLYNLVCFCLEEFVITHLLKPTSVNSLDLFSVQFCFLAGEGLQTCGGEEVFWF